MDRKIEKEAKVKVSVEVDGVDEAIEKVNQLNVLLKETKEIIDSLFPS